MDTKTSSIVANWFHHKYTEVDQQMLPLKKACKKGCDWCCYQSVEILNWEEPLIISYIEKHFSALKKTELKNKLTEWFNYFDKSIGKVDVLSYDDVFVKFHEKQALDRIPCPFLENHICSIYEVRPICCRMHIVGIVEKCKADLLCDATKEAELLRKEFLSKIVNEISTKLNLLNFAVAGLFDLSHRKCKIKNMQVIGH